MSPYGAAGIPAGPLAGPAGPAADPAGAAVNPAPPAPMPAAHPAPAPAAPPTGPPRLASLYAPLAAARAPAPSPAAPSPAAPPTAVATTTAAPTTTTTTTTAPGPSAVGPAGGRQRPRGTHGRFTHDAALLRKVRWLIARTDLAGPAMAVVLRAHGYPDLTDAELTSFRKTHGQQFSGARAVTNLSGYHRVRGVRDIDDERLRLARWGMRQMDNVRRSCECRVVMGFADDEIGDCRSAATGGRCGGGAGAGRGAFGGGYSRAERLGERDFVGIAQQGHVYF